MNEWVVRFAGASLTISLLFVLNVVTFAQASKDSVWQQIDDTELSRRPFQRTRTPDSYGTFKLDRDKMKSLLATAPAEFNRSANETVLELPMPGGEFARFRVFHSPIVEQGLVDKYPELGLTFNGQGIDDPTATVRLDFLPSGFHAMILSPNGTVMVDPYSVNDTENYVSFYKRELPKIDEWYCEPAPKGFESVYKIDTSSIPDESQQVISGATLRTYRTAVAGNAEYCAAASVGGNTVANCLAAQVLIMNRVNGVYEREVALRMVLVANNDLIVYAANNMNCPVGTGGSACTTGNDPYSNTTAALDQNTPNLDAVIGSANYDFGHVFTTGSGGVAGLGVSCGASKGRGTTGLGNPVGDAFAIDFVAHEMGHQWNANHTFNASCGSNRSSSSAYEPGSGVTIMGYAGVCGSQDLAGNSIDTFHLRSLNVITSFSQVGTGNTCDVETATGNTPPTVPVVGGPYNIPKQTPFSLTASATDVNGDTLTYDWQEWNLGATATAIPNSDAGGAMPILRPYLPTTSGTRYFPSLQYIRNNANVPPSTTGGFLTGELLPSITRAMVFQVVVRDNRLNGGGINSNSTTVNVDGASGPFNVTAPNTGVTWAGNSSQTVTWNVANTTAAPVSATNVKISFSTDGGLTFPTTILASTANDGTEAITVPNVTTTQGRIKIEAVGNIFFDMSDANFSTNAVAAGWRAPFDFDGDDKTDLSVFRPGPGEWWYLKSSNGGNAAAAFGASTDRIVPADYTGDGKTDFAFFRASTGQWFVLRSEDFSFFAFPFGTNTDNVIPADFDGDGKADSAVFRPSTLTWFINKSTGGTDIIVFGAPGDKPAVGDYDGDGKADIAIFRPSLGQWWIRRSSTGVVFAAAFGTSTDKPVQGDFTGDGKTDMAFWRPSTGEWFVLRSEDFSFYAFPFGTSTDTPVAGDYDGDNKMDAAVFRSSNNTWYVNRSTAGVLIQTFGIAGDIATPSAYVP